MNKFDLRAYRIFYKNIKAIALILTLTATIYLIDFYLPNTIYYTHVIEKDITNLSGKLSTYKAVIFTERGHIIIKSDLYKKINIGDPVLYRYSKILKWDKGIQITLLDGDLKLLQPFNLFAWNALFAKLMLISLFTLLFKNPGFWMVSFTIISVPVFLVGLYYTFHNVTWGIITCCYSVLIFAGFFYFLRNRESDNPK